MKKEEADQIKKEYGDNQSYAVALDFMSQEKLDEQLAILDLLDWVVAQELPEYALDTTHDLIDTDESIIVRSFWFSKGMNDYYLCINGKGEVVGYDPEIPSRLLGATIKLVNATLSD